MLTAACTFWWPSCANEQPLQWNVDGIDHIRRNVKRESVSRRKLKKERFVAKS